MRFANHSGKHVLPYVETPVCDDREAVRGEATNGSPDSRRRAPNVEFLDPPEWLDDWWAIAVDIPTAM